MENPTYLLYSRMWNLLDLIFPPACGGCEKRGEKWCADCDQETQAIGIIGCPRCGNYLKPGQRVCNLCQEYPPVYIQLRSYAHYKGPLRKAIHRLKYRRDIGLGTVFGNKLAFLFNQLNWPIDMVCPVPLSSIRMNQRGYNQAALIALPFALESGLKYSSRGLTRVRDTASQVQLSRTERQQNVKDAFISIPKYVKNKRVLVVDDVATTGATLNACAAALIAGGAKEVFCLTLARAFE
jgi:ComF family protein